MENLPGNYQKAVTTCMLPQPEKRPLHWTLLLVEDGGRSIQIKWYKTWIVLALVLFSAASGTAVFSYYLYYTASAGNRSLRARPDKADTRNPVLAQSRESAGNTDKAVSVPSVQASAEKSGKPEVQSDSDQTGQTAVPVSAEKPAEPPVQDKTLSESVSNTGESVTPSLSASRVSVEDFACSFSEQGESPAIRFHIRNTSPETGPVSGQVFVILKAEQDAPRNWLLLPEGKTVSGKIPEDAAGESFSISRFRSVEMRAKGQKKPDEYKTATVMVFDENRNIMLEEEFPLVVEKPQ